MKSWSDFFDFVSPDVPGCPQNAQTIALRWAAIDFCERSKVWKYDHPDIPVIAGTADYIYTPPAESAVYSIDYAELGGKEIDSNTGTDGIQIWDWRNQSSTPLYVTSSSTHATLIPRPDADSTLKLTVVLKPSASANGIDDDIFNEYQEAIVHRALAKLMSSPKKPYTDNALSAHHQQQFYILAGNAGTRSDRGYTRAPLRTTIMRRR